MTSLRLLKNGSEAFPAIFAAIDGAASCVAAEMYCVRDDPTGREFRAHLAAAAQRGIDVSVLVDAVGSWGLPDAFWDGLRAAGGKVKWFRPFRRRVHLFRNHRKLVLIDDRIAYLGGMNVADEYFRGAAGEPPWRDNTLEISGQEVARLKRSFNRMWTRAELPFLKKLRLPRNHDIALRTVRRAQFLESGPENPLHPVRRVYRQVVRRTERNIDLAMGYFYPHGGMLRAFRRAVRRGVRVRLLFTRRSDVPLARWAARGLYGRLLRAGVEVWEYLPAMMHAKLAIADDTVIAGSANLDIRSGWINYELVAVVNDPDLAAKARADFEEDLKLSERIVLEEWRKRPVIQRIKERLSYCLLARLDVFLARAEMARRMK